MSNLAELITKLRLVDPKLLVTFHPKAEAIKVLRGKLSVPVDVGELRKRPHEFARRFVAENRALFGAAAQDTNLLNDVVFTNQRGQTHVSLGQKYGAAVVIGSRATVHYGTDGVVYLVTSNLDSNIDVPETPRLTSDQALAIGLQHAGAGAALCEGTKSRLVVANADILQVRQPRQEHALCWQFTVSVPRGETRNWVYFVDAHSGAVVLRYPSDQTGTGSGRYSGGGGLSSEASGGSFRLRDTATTSPHAVAAKPVIHTYDDNGSTSTSLANYSSDGNNVWDNGGSTPAARKDDQRPEVDIQRFLGYVVDYYFHTHGYNGWDGAGLDAKGHAHNEHLANNAFFSSTAQQIFFADGNGTTRDFMCPLDTVAHEYTHGVNYHFDNVQTYNGESGALNEAIADMFGAFISLNHPAADPYPWQHGRQYRLDGTIGRNMIAPSCDLAGTAHYDATSNATKETSCGNGYYPDHYSIRYTGVSDYSGVHWNCPILTHAMYLLINGGTNRISSVTVSGIGVSPVEQMMFDVVSSGVLTSTSNFSDFRSAMIQSCLTLFPENLDYLAAVKTAFHAVGIGPDLYVRDVVGDVGNEPGTLSCMSPDIIVRQAPADAATLAQIGDVGSAWLSQDMELGGGEHSVYFRIFNRGSAAASGTFRLFVSPVSTFPAPTTWIEVGHYDFPTVAASGGMWVPTSANQCIKLSPAQVSSLGIGHFCFIGIIESASDPAPDRTLINSVGEFHAFISKSNNYAWRNCNVVDLLPDSHGETPTIELEFQVNGFDRRFKRRQLDLDTRDLPQGTVATLWANGKKLHGVRVLHGTELRPTARILKVGGTLLATPLANLRFSAIPLAAAAVIPDLEAVTPRRLQPEAVREMKPLLLSPGRLVRLDGLELAAGEKTRIRLVVKFPNNTGARDVALALRERDGTEVLGQLNYIFRIRRR